MREAGGGRRGGRPSKSEPLCSLLSALSSFSALCSLLSHLSLLSAAAAAAAMTVGGERAGAGAGP